MNKKLVIIGACFIFFLMFYKTLFYKPLVGINAYIKTNIRKIESITNADSGTMYLYINSFTKKYILLGSNNKVIINTIY